MFSLGDSVEAYWPDDDQWLAAELRAVLADDGSLLRIAWAEDGSESDVPGDYVRACVDTADSCGSLAVPGKVVESEEEELWVEDVAASSPPGGATLEVPPPQPRLPQRSDGAKPLPRLRGAQRDLTPAWAKKGLGIGTSMFGEATGELLKPGLTKSDLAELERRTRAGGSGDGENDPFGDVFREKVGNRWTVSACGPLRKAEAESSAHAGSGDAVGELVSPEEDQEPVFTRDGVECFDGVAPPTDIPFDEAFNPLGSFSVDFLVCPRGVGGYRSPLTSRDCPPPRGYAFFLLPSGRRSFWVGLPESKEWLKVDGPEAREGEWQRLTGVFCVSSRSARFFVDGALAASRGVSSAGATFGGNTRRPMRLGGGATEGDATKFAFVGDVGDVRVYRCALATPLPAMVRAAEYDDNGADAKRRKH